MVFHGGAGPARRAVAEDEKEQADDASTSGHRRRRRADARGRDGHRIGAQLKAARLARRKTLAEVALESGLTKGFLSKLERDQATASVASLMRLCQTLGIPVGSLFHSSTGEVVRRDAYPPINFGGIGMAEFLLTPQGERRVQAILSEIEPGGGSGDELYGLPADVEFVYVIEGRLEVTLRDHSSSSRAGDAFTFPPRNEHCFRSVARGRAPPGCCGSSPRPATGNRRRGPHPNRPGDDVTASR